MKRQTAIVLVLGGLVGALVACGPAPVISDRDLMVNTPTPLAGVPLVAVPPTAAAVPDSDDPLTIVLGGAYVNGGYWSWADIANLLGVYGEYDVYTTVSVDGVDYTGVPLTYLLTYARLDSSAQTTVFFTRNNESISVGTSMLNSCEDCLLVRAADDTISAILPFRQPSVITQLVRIESR